MESSVSPSRVIIEGVKPQIDGGRYPIKRVVGERVMVEADIFCDGHEVLLAALLYRQDGASTWTRTPMEPLPNDRWRGTFEVAAIGCYEYTVEARIDRFLGWRRDFLAKLRAGQDVAVDLLAGVAILENGAKELGLEDRRRVRQMVASLRTAQGQEEIEALLDELWLAPLMEGVSEPSTTVYGKALQVTVDPVHARFSTWYELFPRSVTPREGDHGTLRDVIAHLPRIARMGFDVLYLPPIHPIGKSYRKGKNNALTAGPGEPGSPWAIGSAEGGHKALHPELGTQEDFRELVASAGERGIRIALDIAFQASPDHPYVREQPEWFKKRPDGTIQYAENPPKKYQDIYPFDFETPFWRELWEELRSVFAFWAEQGVRVFRVDNPHTKGLAFWEWAIAELKRDYPDLVFLSEAFTRPKLMYRLAKLGFTQSYTYFAWRNTKWELTQYFTELTQTEVAEYFRPNLWPNTPDILTEYLQTGGRPAFMARLVLAATLGASYGIYGPAFELMEREPREQGSEEYRDSEKYEIKRWDLDRRESLEDFIALVNRIRRENPALQTNEGLRFHRTDNEELVCYSKATEDGSNTLLMTVNVDPHFTQAGWVNLDTEALGLDTSTPYQVHDLLTGARYLWHGPRNYVQLDPHSVPAHIFRVRRRLHTEQDFDYFA